MNEINKKALVAGSALGRAPRAPAFVLRFGRGRTGGSTLEDLLIQLARRDDRHPLIGDGDLRNPTLSGFYPPGTPGGASRPPTDEAPDMKDWITALIGQAVALQTSLVIDMGGGDRIMQEYGREMSLVKFCEKKGIEPLALYVTGPEADDFDHVVAIWRAGFFRTKRSVLVLNEHLVPQGRTGTGAFAGIRARPELLEMEEQGMKALVMPRLYCMKEMREAGLSFLDAVANKPGRDGKPLDPMRHFLIEEWVAEMEAKFEAIGAKEWLP